ncbi:ComF family protein [Candidatus Shapirobacteria bacterium]|nr:ComF family protein [Candidatus Shapirobacteria bacterium]
MVKYVVSLFLDFLYPHLCYGCATPGTYLCPTCQLSLITKESFHPAKSSLDGAISIYRYTGIIRQMIEDYKFSFVFDLTPTFVDLIYQNLTKNFPHILNYWQENNFVLVPIPLHSTRQNWRGFNQSVLIGELLSPKLKLKLIPDLLVRTTTSIPQSTIKDKRLRRINTKNIFTLNKKHISPLLVKGGGGGGLDKLNGSMPARRGGINDKCSNILLLDDVYTTGSTINSAVSAIIPLSSKGVSASGGQGIWSLTIAG